MAFGKTLYVFSEVNGLLVDAAGNPAAGVTVLREWNVGATGKSGQEETTTDAGGRFSFPEVTQRSLFAGLAPQRATVDQALYAFRPDGQQVLLYTLSKSNYDRDGEIEGTSYRGPGLNMICNVEAEPSADGEFIGTCRPAN